MGHYVRSTLRLLETLGGVEVTLVMRDRSRSAALQEEFDYRIATVSDLRALKPDAVWYPWNAIRFTPHAFSIVLIHDPFAFTFPSSNFVARMREQRPILRSLRDAD